MSLPIKDGAGTDTAVRTTLNGSDHVTHHHIDSMPATADSTGTPDIPAKSVLVSGSNPSADNVPLQVDSSGYLLCTTVATITGGATETKQDAIIADTAAIQTAVELIDDAIYVDDADWTDSTSKHMLVGGLYQSSPQSVTDGDVAPIQLDANGRVGVALSPTDNAVLDAMVTDLAALEVLSTAANALLTTIDSDTNDIKTAVEVIDNAISGSEMQVDVKEVDLPTTVYHGKTTVTTAGTEVTLASSQAIKSGVTIKALSGNTGLIFVGANPVTSTTGLELNAKESVFLEVANLTTVYIDSAVNGEGVTYIAT